MKNKLLLTALLLTAFVATGCEEEKKEEEIKELTSTQVEINGTVYEIMNKTHGSWEFEQDAKTLTQHQFMIMGPEIHMSFFALDELVGQTVDLTKTTVEGQWTLICAGQVDAVNVEVGGNSTFTDDIGENSFIKAERSGDNYNLTFNVSNADGSVKIRANIKGGFIPRT